MSKKADKDEPILPPLSGAVGVEPGPEVFTRTLQHEQETSKIDVAQPDDIEMPDLEEALQRHRDVIAPNIEVLKKQYMDALQFNNEPIAIRIEPSNEENPPMFIDCWVNGRGCEIYHKGSGWVSVGAFPVGVPVVTRRMYVEVLAMAKKVNVKTLIVDPQAERPGNRVKRSVSQMAVFSVLEDKNPKGRAWLRSLISSR